MKKALLLIIFLLSLYPALAQDNEDLKALIFAEKDKELLEITIPLTNTGQEIIQEIVILTKIIDTEGNTITELQETNAWIDPNSTIEIKTTWDTEGKKGDYWILSLIDYDGKKTEQAAKINIDQSPINIEQISVENFNLGNIAEFNIILHNQEDQELKNFYAILELNDGQQNTIAELRSSNIDLQPDEKREIKFYWDTKGIERGEYTGSLEEQEKNTEKYLKMDVNYDSINIEVPEITGQAITIGQSQSQPIVSILFIFLIISNLAWFFFYKKKIKHKA